MKFFICLSWAEAFVISFLCINTLLSCLYLQVAIDKPEKTRHRNFSHILCLIFCLDFPSCIMENPIYLSYNRLFCYCYQSSITITFFCILSNLLTFFFELFFFCNRFLRLSDIFLLYAKKNKVCKTPCPFFII